MNNRLKAVFACAVLSLASLSSHSAFAQTRAAATQGSTATQFQVIGKAMTGVMLTEQFQRAEKANDVGTMRAILAPYGLQVLPPEPQMIPNCQPPYGYPIWAWSNFNGTWMYGWVCVRTRSGPILIDLPPPPME